MSSFPCCFVLLVPLSWLIMLLCSSQHPCPLVLILTPIVAACLRMPPRFVPAQLHCSHRDAPGAWLPASLSLFFFHPKNFCLVGVWRNDLRDMLYGSTFCLFLIYSKAFHTGTLSSPFLLFVFLMCNYILLLFKSTLCVPFFVFMLFNLLSSLSCTDTYISYYFFQLRE
jgi:hypothetical protein